MTPQQEDFAARVARITSGRTGSRTKVFVGPDEVFQYARRSGRGRAGRGFLSNLGHSLAVLASVALGIAGHALALWVLFHLQGLPQPGANPDAGLLMQGAVAFVATMLLGQVLRLRAADLTVAKMLGVAAGVLLFHNAVHLWPALFETWFSPLWVGQVIAATDPQSLHFRGLSLRF